LTDISQWLDSGENIIKKQGAILDQGIANQSDGTLYLTNHQLAFQVSQNTLMRGLDLKIAGQNDAKVEYIWIPLELVNNVEKKGLAVNVETEGSLFQEVIGGGGLFGKKGEGRVFENGPSGFKFSMNIFVNKDEWVNSIISQREKILAEQPQPETPIIQEPTIAEATQSNVIKEKIIIKEVVKVKCRYCDTLYEQRLSRCPHCGGQQ
jgi:hypothetical protein